MHFFRKIECFLYFSKITNVVFFTVSRSYTCFSLETEIQIEYIIHEFFFDNRAILFVFRSAHLRISITRSWDRWFGLVGQSQHLICTVTHMICPSPIQMKYLPRYVFRLGVGTKYSYYQNRVNPIWPGRGSI